MGLTSYTLLPSPLMHVVLCRELKMKKMLNKHPRAGGQKRRQKKSTQHREGTVPLPSRQNVLVIPTCLPLLHTKHCFVLGPLLGT